MLDILNQFLVAVALTKKKMWPLHYFQCWHWSVIYMKCQTKTEITASQLVQLKQFDGMLQQVTVAKGRRVSVISSPPIRFQLRIISNQPTIFSQQHRLKEQISWNAHQGWNCLSLILAIQSLCAGHVVCSTATKSIWLWLTASSSAVERVAQSCATSA